MWPLFSFVKLSNTIIVLKDARDGLHAHPTPDNPNLDLSSRLGRTVTMDPQTQALVEQMQALQAQQAQAQAQAQMQAYLPQRQMTSQFRGVTYSKKSAKWQVGHHARFHVAP